jgi:hypothetical protein
LTTLYDQVSKDPDIDSVFTGNCKKESELLISMSECLALLNKQHQRLKSLDAVTVFSSLISVLSLLISLFLLLADLMMDGLDDSSNNVFDGVIDSPFSIIFFAGGILSTVSVMSRGLKMCEVDDDLLELKDKLKKSKHSTKTNAVLPYNML